MSGTKQYFLPGWLIFACYLHSVTLFEFSEGEREVPGWGVNVRRETSEYIDPSRDTTTISGREICEDPKTEIVIVVESTPGGRNIRDAIRKSWGNHTQPNVRIGFIIGFSKFEYFQDALERESARYKDIIEEAFVESYYNLTLKGISMLKWFVRNCPNAMFLLKADEDTFVDVPLLVHRLAGYRNSKGVLRGYLCSKFDRDDRLWSKWYAPRYLYKYDKYPDFLQGSAYYMSRDVAEKLFAAAMLIPVFHLEDVYITGLCARKAKVKPVKEEGVEYLFGSPVIYCLLPHIITCNSVSSFDLQWVLSERSKRINYSNIDIKPSTAESTIEDESYNENYLEELSAQTYVDEWKTVENETQISKNVSLILTPPSEDLSVATRSAFIKRRTETRNEDLSGVTRSSFIKDQTGKYVTWVCAVLFFLWHQTPLNCE